MADYDNLWIIAKIVKKNRKQVFSDTKEYKKNKKPVEEQRSPI